MKALRWATVLLAAFLALLAWREHRSRAAAAEQLSAIEKNRAEALEQIARIHDYTTAAEKDEDDLRLALERVKSAHAANQPTASDLKPVGPTTPMDALARDPELQAKFLATRRREMKNAFGPLMHKLALLPAVEKKFYDQLMAFEQTSDDIVCATRLQGLPDNDPALAKLKNEAWKQLKSEQAALLGPAQAEELTEYNRTLGARAVVTRFVGIAAYEGMPLSLEQANEMTQGIADANAKYQKGGDTDLMQVDWTVADRKLAAVLSPAQLALFQSRDPVAGGASRWTSSLTRTINQAKAAERKDVSPANPSPRG